MANLATHFSGSDAPKMALAQLFGMVRLQAAVMSFADVFSVMTLLFAGIAALGIIMKRPEASASAGAGH